MTLVLLVLSGILSMFFIIGQYKAYEKSQKVEDKPTFARIVLYIKISFVFIFGCFFNLIGACGGDLSRIGGQ